MSNESYETIMKQIKQSIPSEEPPYVEFSDKGWELTKVKVPAAVGYFSWGPVTNDEPLWVLKRDGRVWMSDSPKELESMKYAIHRAKGTVVIGGLGMGWVAWKCALKDSVDRVIVIERDRDLIEVFPTMINNNDIPFTIHEADIFDVTLNDLGVNQIDFMFIDIWPSFGMESIPHETKTIWENIPAKEVNYWGQEIDISFYGLERHLRKEGTGDKINFLSLESSFLNREMGEPVQSVIDKVPKNCVQEYAESVKLPLSGIDETGYVELCAVIMMNSVIETSNMNLRLRLGF